MHLADLAALRRAVHAVFAEAQSSDPSVLSVALSAQDSMDGLAVEVEYRDSKGLAVGGFGL
jgi:septum formation topological specificity factor MinE